MRNEKIISVVIPVYKSGKHLDELHSRLKETLDLMEISYELIFVEDRGGDNSWDVLQKISSKDSNTVIIQHTRNFGQHAAILCGIHNSSGRWVITMDDDLEHRPEDIPKIYEEINKGYDLVYGVFEDRTHSAWRNITSNLARNTFSFAIPNFNYDNTSFRIMSNHIAQGLLRFDSPFPVIDGYLSWITNNYSTVKLEHGVRGSGQSNYTLGKLIKFTLNILIEFSALPLKVSTWLGLSTSLLGFIWMIFVIVGRVTGGISQLGYSSLMAAILFFGGIQLLVLGIMGEYISKINFKTSKKPLYVISELRKNGDD
ncbi:glycosyltransferase family 2 protein [Solibacillus silvestris]